MGVSKDLGGWVLAWETCLFRGHEVKLCDPTKVALERAALPVSDFSRNVLRDNAYAPGPDCWGDTGEDAMLLLAPAGRASCPTPATNLIK